MKVDRNRCSQNRNQNKLQHRVIDAVLQ